MARRFGHDRGGADLDGAVAHGAPTEDFRLGHVLTEIRRGARDQRGQRLQLRNALGGDGHPRAPVEPFVLRRDRAVVVGGGDDVINILGGLIDEELVFHAGPLELIHRIHEFQLGGADHWFAAGRSGDAGGDRERVSLVEKLEQLAREFFAADERGAVEEIARDELAGERGIFVVALDEQIVRTPRVENHETGRRDGRSGGEVAVRRERVGEDALDLLGRERFFGARWVAELAIAGGLGDEIRRVVRRNRWELFPGAVISVMTVRSRRGFF
ncbi:MAG: hypothetical protein EXS32_09460 [Opitutus sp.]|nr:hypothetical protein [Opitutus sp.]